MKILGTLRCKLDRGQNGREGVEWRPGGKRPLGDHPASPDVRSMRSAGRSWPRCEDRDPDERRRVIPYPAGRRRDRPRRARRQKACAATCSMVQRHVIFVFGRLRGFPSAIRSRQVAHAEAVLAQHARGVVGALAALAICDDLHIHFALVTLSVVDSKSRAPQGVGVARAKEICRMR